MNDAREAVCGRLHKLWVKNGSTGFRELERQLRERVKVETSNVTISTYIHGRRGCPEPERMDVELIIGLATLWKVEHLADISPTIARRARTEAERLAERLEFLSSWAARDSNPEPTG